MTDIHDMPSLGTAFHSMARQFAGKVAVVDDQQSFTYAELDQRSSEMAAELFDDEWTPNCYVGILASRSVQTIIGMLAILKAGGAYVPLEPTYPVDRLRHMARDANLKAVVGDSEAAKACGLGGLRIIDPMIHEKAYSRTRSMIQRADDARSKVKREDPAYVIYTSGSTGQPKGCIISHANVLALLGNTIPIFDFNSRDMWSISHSFSFDFSVWELWGALLTGATAVCVPADCVRSADEFLSFLAHHRITVLNQVPSAFRALTLMAADEPASLRTLRYVILGGESVDLDVVSGFRRALTGPTPTIVNMYGITEVTVHATMKVLEDRDLAGGNSSPIGRPLPHVAIDVRDEHGRVVSAGAPGEMWVSGAGVAVGYLNRPQLTDERFMVVDTAGGPRRAYRTGDLGQVLPDGQLEFLGRVDEQVKIRGFRIELGEIATVLRAHELVADAAATVVRRNSPGAFLVACIVPADSGMDQEVLSDELRRYVSSLLPGHMVPDRFRFLENMPLTPSGKIDRMALSGLDTSPMRS